MLPLMMALTACQFIPGQTARQGPIRADVVPAFATKAESGQPEMLSFPNQVTPQTFATINKPDAKGKFWWVKFAVAKEALPNPAKTEISGDDEDDDPNERSEERSEDAEHDSNPASHRIWIPENGDFKINLVVGSRFQVMDSDARDHEATIQFGSQEQLLAGFLELQGPKSRESKKNKPALERKLTLTESLYNVNQTVSRIGPEGKGKGDKDDKKQPWLKLGKRPFPLPASWNSPDGQKYVLNFSNQGVQRFVTRWYRAQAGAQPDYPVGIKEIGPAGGIVELPGVARLEVPAGALSQKTLVRLSQTLSASSQLAPACDPVGGNCQESWDFASPILKIEPLGLQLKQAARLSLTTVSKYSLVPASYLSFAGSTDVTEGWTRGGDVWKDYFNLRTEDFQDITHNTPIGLKMFVFVSKQFEGVFKQSSINSFKTQSEVCIGAGIYYISPQTDWPSCEHLSSKIYRI